MHSPLPEQPEILRSRHLFRRARGHLDRRLEGTVDALERLIDGSKRREPRLPRAEETPGVLPRELDLLRRGPRRLLDAREALQILLGRLRVDGEPAVGVETRARRQGGDSETRQLEADRAADRDADVGDVEE